MYRYPAYVVVFCSALYSASANSKGFSPGTLDCTLALAQAPDAALGAKVSVNQARYRIGDGLILEITPNSDAYVTVLDHGSDSASPHRDHPLYENMRMSKGKIYRFPERDDQKLEISGPVGENTFEIIVSSTRLKRPTSNSRNVNLIDKPKAEQGVKSSSCTLSFSITE